MSSLKKCCYKYLIGSRRDTYCKVACVNATNYCAMHQGGKGKLIGVSKSEEEKLIQGQQKRFESIKV